MSVRAFPPQFPPETPQIPSKFLYFSKNIVIKIGLKTFHKNMGTILKGGRPTFVKVQGPQKKYRKSKENPGKPRAGREGEGGGTFKGVAPPPPARRA